ncbi:TlpA disulfide reductase family protein [Pedobacter sp. KR3-3]|uniref:TlpA disulfide reductase family protein n=1 Tax=Pedobacter albus TaxID=3113905 RepID=A0ABU7I3D2_9SPHI|nr:TlpA disulfide reductase family protein [Pedobacter sp. KR3-3]MEE1943764.1 TlpA disulfide reductase family protein [Pedobacter sp. KR3-3]
MKKYFLLLCCAFTLPSMAQVSQVLPSRPSAGDTIRLSYDQTSATAKLKGTWPIYARITRYLQDGSVKKQHLTLNNIEGRLQTSFVLPKETASFKVDFYTLNKDDEPAGENRLVYEKDSGKPVKGAYLDSFFSDKVDSLFRLEIAGHPDHYYAYARMMNVVAMIKYPESGKAQINSFLQDLERLAVQHAEARNDAGFMAANCVGLAKTNRLKEAKAYLYQLLDQYPTKAETAFAFSIYNYENYKASNLQLEEDVRAKLKMIYIDYPNAAICADANAFEYLRTDAGIPTNFFEKVIQPLLTTDQLPYYALGNLPELYISRNEKLDTAKQLLRDAIKRFQDGNIQHQFRLNNGHYQMYVSNLLLDLAKVNALQRDFQEAVVHLSAAIQVVEGHSAEGNFMPEMLKQRAKSFEALGQLNLALEDYKRLYQIGEANVAQDLERLYPLCNVKQQTFADFLAALKAKGGQPKAQNPAINFTGTDMQGNKVSLSDLKGKIVVVNIWGIGCGPCIAEMPELNKLVKEYANRKEVVFLAITADPKANLLKFFKTKKFDYKVINQVANVAEIFYTNALPVHVVIGKDGAIINRSIGARADIKTYLKSVIDASL